MNGVSTNFTYVSGTPGSLRREPLVFGVEMEPVVEVEPLVDLKITKSVSDASPKIGDTLTFTLLNENVGVNDASDVVVTDILPSGFSYVPRSISGADRRDDTSPSGIGLSWIIDDSMASDPAVNLTFQAEVNPP